MVSVGRKVLMKLGISVRKNAQSTTPTEERNVDVVFKHLNMNQMENRVTVMWEAIQLTYVEMFNGDMNVYCILLIEYFLHGTTHLLYLWVFFMLYF
jgi:hypothetical protein